MFAIIETDSRQIRVEPGQTYRLDYRADSSEGDAITFDRVLLANGGGKSAVGTPLIEGATVTGAVVAAELKGVKIEVQKIRRRKNSRRHTGHRQKYTTIRIDEISVPGLEVVEQPAQQTEPATAPAEETAAEE